MYAILVVDNKLLKYVNMKKKSKYAGKKWGRLTAVKVVEQRSAGGDGVVDIWLFECECGNMHETELASVVKGSAKSCGCYIKDKYKRSPDITGERFGHLTAISFHEHREKPNGTREIIWLFKCDCGNECIRRRHRVVSGASISCNMAGCKFHTGRTHGMTGSNFYKRWGSMKLRCSRHAGEAHYRNYYGRGIRVCKRWLNFDLFKKDMYEGYLAHVKKHGLDDTTIERKDFNGNYRPENCKWDTWENQKNNKRTSIKNQAILTT